MTRQMQEAYVVAATRTPVGKAPRGVYRTTRPDTLLAHALTSVLAQVPAEDLRSATYIDLRVPKRPAIGGLAPIAPAEATTDAETAATTGGETVE